MFKLKFVAPAALLFLAVPALAQGPRGFPRAQTSTSTTNPAQTAQAKAVTAIQAALNLTSDQVTGLNALLAARKTEMQAVQQDAQTKRKALQTLMAEQFPSPTDLGNAMLAVRGIPDEEKQVETKFQASFTNLLTPAQQQIYAAMENAAQNMGPFRALGLIGGGPGGRGGFGGPGPGPRGMMRGGPPRP